MGKTIRHIKQALNKKDNRKIIVKNDVYVYPSTKLAIKLNKIAATLPVYYNYQTDSGLRIICNRRNKKRVLRHYLIKSFFKNIATTCYKVKDNFNYVLFFDIDNSLLCRKMYNEVDESIVLRTSETIKTTLIKKSKIKTMKYNNQQLNQIHTDYKDELNLLNFYNYVT